MVIQETVLKSLLFYSENSKFKIQLKFKYLFLLIEI